MAHSEHIRQGIKDLSPILPGVIPFGLIVGVGATEAGMDVAHAVGISTIVFAGASQVAAISLIGQNAPIVVIVLTALIINTRFLMYSASLSAHYAGLSIPRRMFAAYLMTDQVYRMVKCRDGQYGTHWLTDGESQMRFGSRSTIHS